MLLFNTKQLPLLSLATLSMTTLLLSLLISESMAFQCYICDSKNDMECVEKLPDDARLKPQSCQNITGAKYCIKTTNVYAGELGTKRFCAANDQGNYCQYIRQPTGDREYRSCVLTCSSENCNGTNDSHMNKWITFISGLLSTVSLITYLGGLREHCNTLAL